MRLSFWTFLSFAATIVIFFTTFMKVMTVPVVSNYVGGTIFQIAAYVNDLSTTYSPWLSQMMQESTGAATAQLLTVGSVALVVLEIIAIAVLVFLALHLLCAFLKKRKASRVFGVLGYILALMIPVAMIAVYFFVQGEMTNALVSINTVAVTSAVYLQLAAAVIGLIAALVATKKKKS